MPTRRRKPAATRARRNRSNRRDWRLGATPRNPLPGHGKEGVDGSSPSEGSAKAPQIGVFLFGSACAKPSVLGMEPFVELSVFETRATQSHSGRDRKSPPAADLPVGRASLRQGALQRHIRNGLRTDSRPQPSSPRLDRDKDSLERGALELVEPRPACWKAGGAAKELYRDWVASWNWGQRDRVRSVPDRARELLAVLKIRADDIQEVGDANDCTLDLLVIGRGGHPVEPAGECYFRSRQRQSVSPWVGRGRTVKVVPT